MIGKVVAIGFNLYTLPARIAYRNAAPLFNLPPTFEGLVAEMRSGSEQVAAELQAVLASVDQEMSQKTAHLSVEQRQQAAELALVSAEKHLSMAAVNVLRALWLAGSASNKLKRDSDPSIIEH